MHYTYTLTKFSAGEAAEITGISQLLQRDWRRRGFLPPVKEGHARFDLFDLARMLVLKTLADRGLGPQHAKEIAEYATKGVALAALDHPHAIDGDLSEEMGQPSAISIVRKTGRTSAMRTGAIPGRFLIVWADGTERWDHSLDHAIASLKDSEIARKLSGPLTVVDQHQVGRVLAGRASYPLVTATIEKA